MMCYIELIIFPKNFAVICMSCLFLYDLEAQHRSQEMVLMEAALIKESLCLWNGLYTSKCQEKDRRGRSVHQVTTQQGSDTQVRAFPQNHARLLLSPDARDWLLCFSLPKFPMLPLFLGYSLGKLGWNCADPNGHQTIKDSVNTLFL